MQRKLLKRASCLPLKGQDMRTCNQVASKKHTSTTRAFEGGFKPSAYDPSHAHNNHVTSKCTKAQGYKVGPKMNEKHKGKR